MKRGRGHSRLCGRRWRGLPDRSRLFAWCAAAIAWVLPAAGGPGRASLTDAANAITELDTRGALEILKALESDAPAVAFERARLSVYLGDCDTASATLGTLQDTPEVRQLAELSKSCAGAVAASVVVEDARAGLWIRLQDDGDRVLVPFITDVAVKARSVVERDFGVVLPRPLRIDLVRDLFSLAAVSGLPVTAAETTGTVAVARWGRVTMLSPRAAPRGYPWEDTLAHEITHLALSRATRDQAPLWLQEGLAKREETRWRAERPFDHEPSPDDVARHALDTGTSVGISQLGPSIAMLPTPYAASVAFAEVTSFIEYWLAKNGRGALHLLLLDLKELGEADAALRSVSGYDLASWERLWHAHLAELPAPEGPGNAIEAIRSDFRGGPRLAEDDPRMLARAVRLGELLYGRGAVGHAAQRFETALAVDKSSPSLRWRAGRALIGDGRPEQARSLFERLEDVGSGHAGWFALRGRFLRAEGQAAESERAFALGIALNPFLEDAACEGTLRVPGQSARRGEPPPRLALRSARCRHHRPQVPGERFARRQEKCRKTDRMARGPRHTRHNASWKRKNATVLARAELACSVPAAAGRA